MGSPARGRVLPRRPPPPGATLPPRSSTWEIPEKNPARLSTRYIPATAAPLIYARARTPSPEGGGGGALEARAGRGSSAGFLGTHLQGTRTGSVRYSEFWERERQGRGNEFPLPASRHPQWRYPHGPAHGEILEKSRIRFPAGSTPSTAAHLISPRTDPAPTGGGGGAPKARVGRGCRQKCMGRLPAKARVGWGPPASSLGTHLQGTRTGSVRYSEFWER